MSLVMDALSTAYERFVRFAPRIIAFASIVFIVQMVVRAAVAVSERFGAIIGALAAIVAFIIVAYLSYVAIRFSFRTLDRPVFDFSLDARGVFSLMIAEILLLLIALPSLLFPLALIFSFVRDVPEGFPQLLVISVPPIGVIVLAVLAFISILLLVRLSMTGFRIVVFGESSLRALRGSWELTRTAFFALLIYSLVPLVILSGLIILLLIVSAPFAFLGQTGLIIITLFVIVFSFVYLLVIDPSLSIGKAKIFAELTHKAHKQGS